MESSNQTNKKDGLKLKIAESDLSATDKQLWDFILTSSPTDLINGIYDTLIQFPAELLWLTRIYQRKKEAFTILKEDQSEGHRLLGEIYKEERNKLEQLANA